MTLTQPRNLAIALPLEAIAGICRRWNLVRLEVFGSALRDDFRSDSDIDLLYSFRPGATVGWEIVDLAEELEKLLGRPVDLVSRNAIEASGNWMRRGNILQAAEVVYEE